MRSRGSALSARLEQQTSTAWASAGVSACGLAGRLAHRIGAADTEAAFEARLSAMPRQHADEVTAASSQIERKKTIGLAT